ncbi:hypothetical protein V8D89_006733 [Ganoderma adspersum]
MLANHGSEDAVRPRKRKRPRTEDPSSQSSTVLTGTAASTELLRLFFSDTVPKHHEEFWFDDGSIVLVAGNTGFRVYRALLAAQSTVFTDMLSSGPDAEETCDGCPVVHLSDSPEDVAHFLRVLLPKSQRTLFSRDFSFSFHQISAIIRLAHKYHVQDVLDQAIASLQEYFTSSFDAWESRIGQAAIKVRSQQAIGIVNLARLVDRPSLLPIAFYKCATLGSAVLNGYKREDKSVEHLTRKDAKRCLDGRIRLAEASLSILAEVFVTRSCQGCVNRARFRTALQAMLGDAIRHEAALSPTVLLSWKDVVGDWARAHGLCGVCKKAALERDVKARRKVWDSLPQIFDIEVEGWVAGGGDGGEADTAAT